MVDNTKLDAKGLEALGILDIDCVIVDKVFASCQQRECFPEVEVDIKDCKKFGRIRFRPGFIVPNTLDVTDIEGVSLGDEVVIFGYGEEGYPHADELAEKMGTINYEIVCMISRRIPRVYISNGSIIKVRDYLLED